jgi:hypothetical protein
MDLNVAPEPPALTPAERAAFQRFCAHFKEAARAKAGAAHGRAAELFTAAADAAAVAFAPDSAPVLTARVEALRCSELSFGPGSAGSAAGFLFAAAHPDDAATLALARALLAATASRVDAWPRDCDATRAESAFFGALKVPGGDDVLAGAMPSFPLLASLAALQSLLAAAQQEPRVADAALGHDVTRIAAALRRASGGGTPTLAVHGAPGGVRHAAFRFLGDHACVTMEEDSVLELCAHTLERINVMCMAVRQLESSAQPATAARAKAFMAASARGCDMLTGESQLFEAFGLPQAVSAGSWDNMVAALMVQKRQAAEHASGAPPCGNPECWARGRPRPNAFKKCSLCRNTAYCGPACQAADWKRHKRAECVGGAGPPAAPAPAAPAAAPAMHLPPGQLPPGLLDDVLAKYLAKAELADMRSRN